MLKSTFTKLAGLSAFALAGSLMLMAPAQAAVHTGGTGAPGNNGTLKIHEQGTPSGTENNDPKVCVFNVESFGLDSGQTGYLSFKVQGGDKPTGTDAGPYSFGPADATGYFASQYFNLKPGHYKATLYGKMLPGGKLSDIKAKSKVFKVTCETETPSPTPTPTTPSPTPTSPSPTPTSPSPTPTPTSPSPTATSPTPTATNPSPSNSTTTPVVTPSPSPTLPSGSNAGLESYDSSAGGTTSPLRGLGIILILGAFLSAAIIFFPKKKDA